MPSKLSFVPYSPRYGLLNELVEPVLVVKPSLVSRVDLTRLASKQQTASTREMGKNHSPAVVLGIWPKFWWMLPMGVIDNDTKCEPETQPWRPGKGIASATSISKSAI